jgi:hypothetical protein
MREKEEVGRKERQNSEGGSYILRGAGAGGDDNTAYGAAIPETAKLTGSGNSQVLVLQGSSWHGMYCTPL